MILAMKSEQRRKMSRQEAGRKGGKKVAQERGTAFYREIGKKGGEKVAEERVGKAEKAKAAERLYLKEDLGREQRSQASRRNKRRM
jgi:general stress protein YciG